MGKILCYDAGSAHTGSKTRSVMAQFDIEADNFEFSLIGDGAMGTGMDGKESKSLNGKFQCTLSSKTRKVILLTSDLVTHHCGCVAAPPQASLHFESDRLHLLNQISLISLISLEERYERVYTHAATRGLEIVTLFRFVSVVCGFQ